MFDLVRVGIPIRDSFISDTFINIVNEIKQSTNCIAVSTVDYTDGKYNTDYRSAPAGHNILFNNLKFKKFDGKLDYNVINTLGFIWDVQTPAGVNRDSDFISLYLLEFFKKQQDELKFNTVYMFTPGSPHIWDMFTHSMPKYYPVSVIDTYSSLTIVGNKMREYFDNKIQYKLRHYNMDFITQPNKVIYQGVINIFGGIANGYNHNQGIPLVEHFFLEMRKVLLDDDLFLYCTITENETQLTVIPFKNAFEKRNIFSNANDIITYGVYKK